jgi:membrane associated rhomboid family serine protease
VIALPLRDVIPSRTTPLVTIALILVNAAAFIFEQALTSTQLHALTMLYGLVPVEFTLVSLLTSMFLHAGWMHFVGNMLYLWIFGDNVEDRLGHGRFLLFYLACGAAAGIAQTLSNPVSFVPMIGASGAIAGVMGAYFLLFPHSRVLTFVWLILYFDLVEIPAIFFLGFWFFMQLLSGLGSSGFQGGGTAFWAHAAGFAAGAGLVMLLRRPERQKIEWIE